MPSVEFICFVVVGVIGFVVDGGGTWLLGHAGLSPLFARIPPLFAAILVTWLLNRSLTFNVDKPRSGAELARYAKVALTSGLLNFILYNALVLGHLHPLPAVAAATLIQMLFTFTAYRRLVFR